MSGWGLTGFRFRNAPCGGWLREIPADCDPNHVDWPAFQGEAKHVPFDPQRYINWRFYWDYSGGNVFENMVHTLGFWFGALGLSIPDTVTMTGANYLAPRVQVPDTFQVALSHPEKLLPGLEPAASVRAAPAVPPGPFGRLNLRLISI